MIFAPREQQKPPDNCRTISTPIHSPINRRSIGRAGWKGVISRERNRRLCSWWKRKESLSFLPHLYLRQLEFSHKRLDSPGGAIHLVSASRGVTTTIPNYGELPIIHPEGTGEGGRSNQFLSDWEPSQLELQSGSERNFIESVKPSPSCSLFCMYIGGERRWFVNKKKLQISLMQITNYFSCVMCAHTHVYVPCISVCAYMYMWICVIKNEQKILNDKKNHKGLVLTCMFF